MMPASVRLSWATRSTAIAHPDPATARRHRIQLIGMGTVALVIAVVTVVILAGRP